MKKRNKIVLSILAVLLVTGVGIGIYALTPILAMKPAKTGSIPLADRQHYAIRSGRGALYFYDTGNGYIMVDAGTNANKLKADLDKFGIDPTQVKWILLTHSDSDHVAGLPLFPHAEIYLGEAELDLLNGTVNRSDSGGNTLPDGVAHDTIRLLADGDKLTFGGVSVKCITAPGHTPGSMAYFINEAWLFTGDAFRYSNENISTHPFTMDEAQAGETNKKLADLIFEGSIQKVTFLTSHYGIFTPSADLPRPLRP